MYCPGSETVNRTIPSSTAGIIPAANGSTSGGWRVPGDWDTHGNLAFNFGPNVINAWTSIREVNEFAAGPPVLDEKTCARWTAPVAGSYHVYVKITGRSTKNRGTTIGCYVYVNGSLDTSYHGIAKSGSGKLYYVKGGVWAKDFNGIASANGKKYYIKAGRVQSDFSGTVKTKTKVYTIKNGVVTSTKDR